jgi:hypothetical protein
VRVAARAVVRRALASSDNPIEILLSIAANKRVRDNYRARVRARPRLAGERDLFGRRGMHQVKGGVRGEHVMIDDGVPPMRGKDARRRLSRRDSRDA